MKDGPNPRIRPPREYTIPSTLAWSWADFIQPETAKASLFLLDMQNINNPFIDINDHRAGWKGAFGCSCQEADTRKLLGQALVTRIVMDSDTTRCKIRE